MKRHLFFILFLAFVFVGCKKDEAAATFEIVATNYTTTTVTFEIEKESFPFSSSELRKQVTLQKYDVKSASLQASNNGAVKLQLFRDGKNVGEISGSGYIYMIIDNDGLSSSSSTSGGGTSGGGTSSGCSTVQCSSYTQSGSRCSRMTTNCNGRCWQHQ